MKSSCSAPILTLYRDKSMSFRKLTLFAALFAAIGLGSAAPGYAQVKIGVVTSATGPTAMVGIPQKNTVPLLPTQVGDLSVEYISLDDVSDPTQTVIAFKKQIGRASCRDRGCRYV